jgi:hypothetical protein
MTQLTEGEAERPPTVREVCLPLPTPNHGSAHARAFVRGALSCWDVDSVTLADVEHVASELVALAFRLGSASLELELSKDDGFVHVRVRGPAGAQPTAGLGSPEVDDPEVDSPEEDSPELFVVGRLATDWWAHVDGGAVDMWARVMEEDGR